MPAYIVDYVRTPFGRFGGTLASVRADDLAAVPIRALMKRHSEIDPARIDEVILGCANQAGEDNRNVARMAVLLAGLPASVPGTTVNRLCGSGLDAVAIAARQIKVGEADLIVAGGVESMSRAPFVMPKADSAYSRRAEIHDTTIGWRFVNPQLHAAYGTDSMPETGENVAEDFRIGRTDQDAFAFRSQKRAAVAREAGRFELEIVPVDVVDRKGRTTCFAIDEHIRPETTIEALASLPTPFRVGGTVTAGNASGVNDGAVALLIASEDACARWNLTPLARIDAGATAGIEPRIMGFAPALAVRKLLERTGATVGNFDIVELNEAFASQALAVTRHLGLADDADYVNPNGGAIALGHPLGASGARLVGTAAFEMRRTGTRRALVTMCIGVGQGIALSLSSLNT